MADDTMMQKENFPQVRESNLDNNHGKGMTFTRHNSRAKDLNAAMPPRKPKPPSGQNMQTDQTYSDKQMALE